MTAFKRLGVVSLEPWDEVWRRNQHLASSLVGLGVADRIQFVAPPASGAAMKARRWSPQHGVDVIVPPLRVPRSAPGGYELLDRWVRRSLRQVDGLWINDAAAGLAAVRDGIPTVYDVTDDWRVVDQPRRDRERLIAAEEQLAQRVTTVVCSQTLADRWRDRFGVDPVIVQNGVDLASVRAAPLRALEGPGPHAVYVGTLHANRIDVLLLESLARSWSGTLHLVGPNGLGEAVTKRLSGAGAQLVGAVTALEVPSWLKSADVLVCPHMVDEFTLSLDAIKAHEYLATNRPIVATPSSGFQRLSGHGLSVVLAADFVSATLAAVGSGPFTRDIARDWADRAAQFAAALGVLTTDVGDGVAS